MQNKISPIMNGVFPKVSMFCNTRILTVDFGVSEHREETVIITKNNNECMIFNILNNSHEFSFGNTYNSSDVILCFSNIPVNLIGNVTDFINSQLNDLGNNYIPHGAYMEQAINLSSSGIKIIDNKDIQDFKRAKELIESGLSNILVEYKENGIPSFADLIKVISTKTGFSVIVKSNISNQERTLSINSVKINKDSLSEAENKALNMNIEITSKMKALSPSNF